MNNRFLIGILLNTIFIVAEVFYGLQSDSLALIADAVHNAGDVLGLFIAWFGYWLSHKVTSEKFTYGYKNATIIAAFMNAILLFISVGVIMWEAIHLIGSERPIMSTTGMIVAFIGVIINGLTAFFFFHDRHNDINIQGAFLHMLLDALVSVGVIIAGAIIFWKSWFWIDAIISLTIAIVILISSWGLFKESLNLILVAIPASIDIQKLREIILEFSGLIDIHDLDVWPISTTETGLSAHLVVVPKAFQDSFTVDIEKNKSNFSYIAYYTTTIKQ